MEVSKVSLESLNFSTKIYRGDPKTTKYKLGSTKMQEVYWSKNLRILIIKTKIWEKESEN